MEHEPYQQEQPRQEEQPPQDETNSLIRDSTIIAAEIGAITSVLTKIMDISNTVAIVIAAILLIVFVLRRFRKIGGRLADSNVWAMAKPFIVGIGTAVLVMLLVSAGKSVLSHPGTLYVDGVDVTILEWEDSDMDGTVYSFNSPECLSYDSGILCLTDGGNLLSIENGTVRCIPLGGYAADFARAWGPDIYVLTKPYADENYRYFYSILRVRGGVAEEICEPFLAGEGYPYMRITDFSISPSGNMLWFVQQDAQNTTNSSFTLNRLSFQTESDSFIDGQGGEPEWFADLQQYVSDMNRPMLSFGVDDTLYISAPEDGAILRIKDGEQKFTVFSGTAGELGFDDGTNYGPIRNLYRSRFQNPTSIASDEEYVYVLDSGTVRRISLNGWSAGNVRTLAGRPMREREQMVKVVPSEVGQTVSGRDAVFQPSSLATIALDGNGNILLSDPDNRQVYQISIR